MITHNKKIDMYPASIPVVVHLSQYDDDFSIVFTLYSSVGTFAIESGTTAEIRGTKTDGNGYSADATINISANTVTVAGNKQMTACAGQNTFELVLWKGQKELSTANFILDVEPAALDSETITSESQIKELVDVLSRADEIVEAAQTVEDAVYAISFTDPENDGNIVIAINRGV